MSKEKQQTAVEWLVSKMPIQALVLINDEVIVKAKEMEKQQIKIAFTEAESFVFFEKYSEDYYNETYGK